MGNQTWWDITEVKSLYTTHFVPMHSRRESERQKEKEQRFSGRLFGSWAGPERALVIWSARQLGLSSETQ